MELFDVCLGFYDEIMKIRKENIQIRLDYGPFDEALKAHHMSKNFLKEKYEISCATISRMKNHHDMTLATAGHLMNIVGIDDLNDFVSFKEEVKENE